MKLSTMDPEYSRRLSPRGVVVVGASIDLTRSGGQPVRPLTESTCYPLVAFPDAASRASMRLTTLTT